jgi:2-polyprenyl-6-methoxyphenol hydroxylase-like FAD-dependent oxidoreductase
VTTPVGREGIAFWKKTTPEQRAEIMGERAGLLRGWVNELAGFYPTKLIHTKRYAKGNVVLLGDAAHSIHPARGQGLNVGIYSLGALIERLPARLSDAAAVRAALAAYDAYQHPRYDKVFARNHQAALDMEASLGENAEAFVRKEDEIIRMLHTHPDMRRAHALEACGYPFGLGQ